MREEIFTKRGYKFYEVTSALQKSIRRNDIKIAGYFAIELFESGFWLYIWKRLLTISAEDCWGIITTEIYNLFQSFLIVNHGNDKALKLERGKIKGRIFISKAVILLCLVRKNRDADHLQNLIYDKQQTITDEEIDKILMDNRKESIEIPEYTYDVHTRAGKYRGMTKEDFFISELEALNPRQKGLFDNLVEVNK